MPDRPDALMLDARVRKGRHASNRVASVCDIAEPILGVDKAAGEHAWIHLQPHNWLFVSKSVEDTINFPHDHERDGQERYHWVVQPDGSKWGYLVDGASPDDR
jgi:hypothetical protein